MHEAEAALRAGSRNLDSWLGEVSAWYWPRDSGLDRRNDDETSKTEPLRRVQGESGDGGDQGGPDAVVTGADV